MHCLCLPARPPAGLLAGVQLLPESYAVLIFASMDATPPDVDIAKTLYRAIAGTGTEPQLPWSTLCRLLAGKGFAADTVTIVREGLRAGLMLDADVAEAYVKGLAETQQLVSDLFARWVLRACYGLGACT